MCASRILWSSKVSFPSKDTTDNSTIPPDTRPRLLQYADRDRAIGRSTFQRRRAASYPPIRRAHRTHRAFTDALDAGYEGRNDHDTLGADRVFELSADRSSDDADLASHQTHSRFENAATAACSGYQFDGDSAAVRRGDVAGPESPVIRRDWSRSVPSSGGLRQRKGHQIHGSMQFRRKPKSIWPLVQPDDPLTFRIRQFSNLAGKKRGVLQMAKLCVGIAWM